LFACLFADFIFLYFCIFYFHFITMIVRSVSLTGVACLMAAEAFTVNPMPKSRSMAALHVASQEAPSTDCIDEAVQLLEENETVKIRNDLPKPDVTKDDRLEEIMETIEADPFDIFPDPTEVVTEAMESASALANDIAKKFSFFTEEPTVTPEEAAVSASLYMNPATAKIAKNLVVTWEPQAAEALLTMEKLSNPNKPFMVGIVGIPGSGKSTSSEILAALLGEERAIVMPMDGFHIPLAGLAEFPNAADAIYRRGAPDTFDAAALKKELTRIAYGDEPVVTIPGFDHAVGDPTPDQHTFKRDEHRIVLCEGLYLLHDDDGWEDIKAFFDWTIYIDADVDVCIERLKERNKCIPGYTPEEIEIRCDAVDRVNAETSRDGAYKYASQIVFSGASCK
jgi:pantothenate kinase